MASRHRPTNTTGDNLKRDYGSTPRHQRRTDQEYHRSHHVYDQSGAGVIQTTGLDLGSSHRHDYVSVV
jgi:hypothetical protein